MTRCPVDLETICLKAMAKDPRGGTVPPGRWPMTSAAGSQASRFWHGRPAGWNG